MHELSWRWGALKLSFSNLTLFTAVVVGLIMVYVEGRRKLLPEQKLIDFLLIGLVGGLIGGRLAYGVLFNLTYYLEKPVRLLYFQDGGFSFWGGLVSAFILVSLWANRKKLIVERYLDAAAPALAFSLSWGYTGSPLGGVHMESSFPWALTAGGAVYHPDGAYAIILFMSIYYILKLRRSRAAYEGELFIWFLLGCGLNTIMLDFVRELPRACGFLTAGQLFSLVVVVLSFFFIAFSPKINIVSSYLDRSIYRQKHVAETVAFFLWHLLLTGGMVLLYYWAHRPLIFQ